MDRGSTPVGEQEISSSVRVHSVYRHEVRVHQPSRSRRSSGCARRWVMDSTSSTVSCRWVCSGCREPHSTFNECEDPVGDGVGSVRGEAEMYARASRYCSITRAAFCR